MKKVSALFVMMLTLVALTSSAFAWPARVEGKPDAFRPGDARGYFIWHDRDGFHLYTTTYGRNHQFTGVIRTDGKFVDVNDERGERGDVYRVDSDRNKIAFRFNTAGGADGLSFRVREGSAVNFDLYMDGHKINAKEIYIGDDGWHPKHQDFTLYR